MEQNELTMPTKYDPQSIEQGRYKWWLDGKYFEAQDDDSKQPYTIVIPPPNVTGKLHL
jgi:valyl-tRNA synthetase